MSTDIKEWEEFHKKINMDMRVDIDLMYFLYYNNITKGKVVDIGCGQGGNLKYMQEVGLEVIGIDYAKEAIDKASKHTAHKNLIVGDFMDHTKVYECVVDVACLASSKNIEESIKKIAELTKPKGKIFLKELYCTNDKTNKMFRRKGTLTFIENNIVDMLKDNKVKIENIVITTNEQQRITHIIIWGEKE